MRISSVSTIVLLLVGSLCCEAKEPTLYLLGNGIDPSQPQAVVKLQRTSNSGALLLLTFDGVDPRTFPSMEKIEARVKAADAAMKAGQKPGLINSSPGRNEPELVGVAPGTHKYGVMFMMIDVSKAHLLGNSLAFTFSKKYLPGNTEASVTVKHYEELSFNAEAGKNYSFQYVWTPDTTDLKLIVQQCSPKWDGCTSVAFDSGNAQTKVLPGVSDQEL